MKKTTETNRAAMTSLIAQLVGHGMAQKEIAALCQVTPSAVSAWKTGKSMGTIAQRETLTKALARFAPAKAEKKEVSQPRASKLRIIEACAVDGCDNPALSGGLCETHGEEAAATNTSFKDFVRAKAKGGRKAAEAKWDELAKENAPAREETKNLLAAIQEAGVRRKAISTELGVVSSRLWRWIKGEAAASPEHRAQLIALLGKAKALAEAKASAKAAKQAERAAKKEARASKAPKAKPAAGELSEKTRNGMVMAKQLTLALRGAGKSDEEIAKIAGVSSTLPVTRWAEGSSAGQTYQRRNMEKHCEKLGLVVSGSIGLKAKASKAARNSKRLPKVDQRQLILDLQKQLNALLKAQ